MIPSLGCHALKALTPQTAVTIDRSRCVRHRCKRNKCSQCLDVCQVRAITWEEHGLQVSSNLCTRCLRCMSICPTAALQSPELSLLQVFTDLAAQQEPVLGCTHQTDSKAHTRLPCLGALANTELMLLFALVFVEGVQVNLTCCQDCPNGHILEGVHAAHNRLTGFMPGHKVKLVYEQESLEYQSSSLSRRELFGFFRERSKRSAMVMAERLHVNSKMHSFGSKQVPLVRTMLLKVMETMSEAQQQWVSGQLFGQVSFASTCTACGGCVGVCPTGAIESADEDKHPPTFNRDLCVECGSCQAFCRKQSVQLAAVSI
ncbi:MAG: hypothetical protein DRH08_02235 [Deltaproteobacteria bacterium]|nr:MAG: hypothetical protein DRH08_02235 [Deltaproteobacteria bacterium]